MASQLAAEYSSARDLLQGLASQPEDALLLRHAVTASAVLRRADGLAHVLDILTGTARLVAPSSAVWALRRAGRTTARASAFDTTAPFGAAAAACRLDADALLDDLGEKLEASQSPFDVGADETPLHAALATGGEAFALTAFPLGSTDAPGALLVAVPEEGLSCAQRSVLALLCDEAAGALALETARSTADQAEALFETLTRLSASFSERELVLQQIVRSTADLLRTDAAWIMLVDDEKKLLRTTTMHGITSTTFVEATCGTDELLPGAAIRKRRTVCIGDLRGDDRAKRTKEEGLRSVFCAPMFVQDELLGVLIAGNRETRDLSPEDRRIMDALSSAAAVSIGNARLYAERESSIERLAGVNALLEERSAFQQRLTDLVLAGAELGELVAAATEALGARVLVLDRDLVVLHANDDSFDSAALRTSIDASDEMTEGTGVFSVVLADGADETTEVLVAPLELGGERTAYVVVVGDGRMVSGRELGMTEAAVTAIGLELMRERATAEAEARLTGGLFQTLLADDGSDDTMILRRSSYLGYELAGENVVIAAAARDDRPSGARPPLGLQSVVQRAVRRHWDAPTPVFERDDAVFVVLSDPVAVTPALIKEQCRLVRQAIELSGASAAIQIAYAGPHKGIAGVRRAVGEAAYALQVQEVIGKGGAPVAFSELGVWTLLGRVGNRDHLLTFANSVLGELLAHDEERQAQFVDTLRTLIKCNFHYRTAAEALYAHPNTIRYRMSRISALTGLDLADGDDRLKVELALRILDVVGPRTASVTA
jgi:hypothetical protein